MKYVNAIRTAAPMSPEIHQPSTASGRSSSGAAVSRSPTSSPARCSSRRASRRFATWYTTTTQKIGIPCRMITNSRGTSVSICNAVSPRERIAQRIAANTIPIGLFWPRNATAIP